MFIVCNKDKIVSYMVSFFTVMILLGIAFYMRNNSKMLEVSSTSKQLPIYSVKTDEKKVAFTMNCAWNADDIDQILKTLEENDVKITFFMVGDWVDKYPEAVKKINDAGHEIGNHSNTHPHVNNLTYEKNISEIEECNKKIEKIKKKMVNEDVIFDMAELFKVFGDSTRMKIISALLQDELCVGEIAEITNSTQSAISHQLRVLKQAKLVKFKKVGKTVYYSLDDDHIYQIYKLVKEHIEE